MTLPARAALLLVGALLGGGGGPTVAARLAPAMPLDPAVWSVVTPARADQMVEPGTTRGVWQADGAMVLLPHTFGRTDLVSPRDPRFVARLELELAPGSAELPLQLRGADGKVTPMALFGPSGWRQATGASLRTYPRPGPVEVVLRDGRAWIDGEAAGATAPGTLELHAGTGIATLTALRLYDNAGEPILAFGGAPTVTPAARAAGALGGALVAGLLAVALRTARIGEALATLLFTLLPPALVLTVDHPGWVAAVERLYLAKVDPSALQAAAFAAACLPLGIAALLGSHALAPARRRRRRLPVALEGAIVLVVTAAASRALTGPWLAAALPGAAFVAFPAWNARRAGDTPAWALLRDAPALVALAGLGWGAGLLPAVVWRGVCLLADAPRWVHDHARAGADAALVLLLAGPLATELAVRTSPAGRSWDPAATVAGPDPRIPPEPAWEGGCGDDVVYAMGGSSTGGAFQFANEPGAFWPARLHTRLCADGEGVHTMSLGGGDRTTFEMAAFAPALYRRAAPAVTIVYAGVNDLLGRNAPLTRRQAAERAGAVATPVGALGVSRLLYGLSLALRPPADAVENVQAVPLADAEANLRALAASTTSAGGRLLLVTEYTRGGGEPELRPYWEMERRLAAEVPGVRFLDLYPPLADVPVGEVLADANHHTHAGADRVAGLIEPEVRALLAERR